MEIAKTYEYYIHQIEKAFDEDDFLKCYHLCEETEEQIKSHHLKSETNKDLTTEELLELFYANSIIIHIRKEKLLVDICERTEEDIKTLKPKIKDDIYLWFIKEENLNTVTVAAKTIVKAPLIHVLSVLAEIDLMKKFVERMNAVDKICTRTNFRWLLQAKIKMPFMISDREILISASGFYKPDSRTIFVPLTSPKEENYFNIKIPPTSKNYSKVDMIFGFFKITFIDNETTEITNCYNIDANVPLVPVSIVNMVVKETGFYVMSGIKKQMENKKNYEEYAKRRELNSQFYENIKEKLNLADIFN